MKRSLANILRPGPGDAELELVEISSNRDEVDYGLLYCATTNNTVLILSGFPMFTEMAPFSGSTDFQALKSIEDELVGNSEEYQRFVADKWRRPNRDAYAAFQPFNESTRALYPLVPLLRDHFQPGDYILDIWCRTGWSGELLAALFPRQNIVSMWEGNHGTLGYRAFRHWLPHHARADNLEILFHNPNDPFPFNSESFSAIIGLDTLHRYDADHLLRECQRVGRDDAPILFPHVHLTNSEPDPWFERGCRQEHGAFWSSLLEAASVNNSRRAYVESEMALFSGEIKSVANNPSTRHYNALIGLVPQAWIGAPLAGIDDHFAPDDSSYIVLNPLLAIDLNRLQIELRTDDEDGMTEHILSRHPGYQKYLQGKLFPRLSAEQSRVLYWAGKVLPLGVIAAKMATSSAQIKQWLAPLIAADIALLLPISSGMAKLNHYFANQDVVVPTAEQNLAFLWKQSVRQYPNQTYVVSLADELELSYAELDQLVEVAAGRLLRQLQKPGAAVCVAAEKNLETVVLFWAAQRIGSPFVVIDPAWSAERISQLTRRHQFKLLFTDIVALSETIVATGTQLIFFETEKPVANQALTFEVWLDDKPLAELPEGTPPGDSTSVILFTSGTTGTPKGVQLSHQAIWQSAHTFARHYLWHSEDVYLSLGNFANMSGLRNPLVSCAMAGSRFIIPQLDRHSGVLDAVSTLGNHGVTIMGVVPAFIKRLAGLAERLDKSMFSNLRCFVSTAANLDPEAARLVANRLGVPVYNYYGLTETCGACIYMHPTNSGGSANLIGKPVDAIAQIVSSEGNVECGSEPGELRIYSGNLMNGYLDETPETDNMIRGGWLYTDDICRWSHDDIIELIGRKKDVIKTPSGALIYSEEVERVLANRRDIDELAVAAYVDEHGDERLVAFIQGTEGSATESLLSQFNGLLRSSLSPDHQLSRVIGVNALPRGANEKISKSELVRLHLEHKGEDVCID